MAFAVLGLFVAVVVLGYLYVRERSRSRYVAANHARAIEAAIASRTATLQEELNRAARLATVGQLVAGVGHEINNPLAYVLTNLELVAEQTTDDEEMRALVGDAKDGVERIRQIVRDLQIFSRTDENEHMVDLNQIVQRSVRMANTQMRQAARIRVELGEVPSICASETRLGQVFLNLMINAAQAIGTGNAGQNEICIRSFTDAQRRAVIEVGDTGPGMSKEVRARIFDPFFTTKAVGCGTGLGLSICRSIVLALRGDLEVESEPGKGAVFRVTLPQPKVRRERKASLPLAPSNARKRVLVIDDEPLICRAIQKSLDKEHDIVTTVSSRGALEQIRGGERFDVIFCDLMMPELSGMDLYEALRVSAPDLLSRVVFMTGGVLDERTRGFLVGMANPLMEKPLRSKSVRRIVAESTTHPSSGAK